MRSSVLFPYIQIVATTLIKPPLVTIIKCVPLFCGIYTNSIALITSLFSRIFSPLASKSNCKSRENITKYKVLHNLFNANIPQHYQVFKFLDGILYFCTSIEAPTAHRSHVSSFLYTVHIKLHIPTQSWTKIIFLRWSLKSERHFDLFKLTSIGID